MYSLALIATVAYDLKLLRTLADPDDRRWAAAVDRGEFRDGRARVQLRAVRHRRRPAVLVPRRRPARHDGASSACDVVKRWLIVAGDFTPLGGMDAANHALARYLAAQGEVHLVTHRAWPDLHALPGVIVRCVRRPFGRHALGSGLLARAGGREWKRLQPLGAQAIVNGGNCRIPGAVNWVHYLHAAYRPTIATSTLGRARRAVIHRRDLAAERTALVEAPLVICNSRRTRDDVVEHIGIDPSRVRVVYYGGDPVRFSRVTPEQRIAARAQFGWSTDRPSRGLCRRARGPAQGVRHRVCGVGAAVQRPAVGRRSRGGRQRRGAIRLGTEGARPWLWRSPPLRWLSE